MGMSCVFFEAGTEFLNIIFMNFSTVLPSPERRAGEAWEPSNKGMLFLLPK
jgi:hypothetical protein